MDVIRHFVKVGLHFLFSHVASTLTLLMNRLNILPREQANSEFVKFLLSKEAKRKSFLVKVSFLCVRITDHFRIIGFALCLAPKQRLGAFRKWPCFVVCIDWKGIFNCNCLEQRWLFRKELFISRGCRGRALSYVSRKSTTLEQFRFSRRKPHIFSVKLTRCIRTPVNTDSFLCLEKQILMFRQSLSTDAGSDPRTVYDWISHHWKPNWNIEWLFKRSV